MESAALIFNADGTISETDETHRKAFNLAFRDHDLPWHWSHAIYGRMIDSLTARSKITTFLRRYRPDETDCLENDALMISLVSAKRKHYIDLIEMGEATLRPGVSRLINEAKHLDLKLGIISLNRRQDFEVILQNHFGLGALANFNCITTIEDVGRIDDPDTALKAIYSKALSTLHADPLRSVAIEARESGTEAAASLGMKVVATPGLYTSSCRFETASLVISDLGHPAAPFQVIRGDAGRHHFVSVDALNSWQFNLDNVA